MGVLVFFRFGEAVKEDPREEKGETHGGIKIPKATSHSVGYPGTHFGKLPVRKESQNFMNLRPESFRRSKLLSIGAGAGAKEKMLGKLDGFSGWGDRTASKLETWTERVHKGGHADFSHNLKIGRARTILKKVLRVEGPPCCLPPKRKLGRNLEKKG